MADKSGAQAYGDELISIADNALKLAQLNYGKAQEHEGFGVDFNAVDVAQVFAYEEAKNTAKDPNSNLEVSTRYIFGHDAGYENKTPLRNDKDLIEVTLSNGEETVKYGLPANMLKDGDALFNEAKAELKTDIAHDKTDSRANYNAERETMLNTTPEGAAIKEWQSRPVEELQKSREELTQAIYDNKELTTQVIEEALTKEALDGMKTRADSPLSYIKDEKLDTVKDVVESVKSDNQSELAEPKKVEKPIPAEKAFADEVEKRETEKPVTREEKAANDPFARPEKPSFAERESERAAEREAEQATGVRR